MTNNNCIFPQNPLIKREDRELQKKHRSFVLWFTGLSSSGKSTNDYYTEKVLYEMGFHTYVLDGNNMRHGLCKDLGFSESDRRENIRRVAEVVKLFIDAGIITLAAFVSPYRKDREMAKAIIEKENFFEIYVKRPLQN